jgi:hypothetical protein
MAGSPATGRIEGMPSIGEPPSASTDARVAIATSRVGFANSQGKMTSICSIPPPLCDLMSKMIALASA